MSYCVMYVKIDICVILPEPLINNKLIDIDIDVDIDIILSTDLTDPYIPQIFPKCSPSSFMQGYNLHTVVPMKTTSSTKLTMLRRCYREVAKSCHISDSLPS
jgi:hypothetical protein